MDYKLNTDIIHLVHKYRKIKGGVGGILSIVYLYGK